MDICYIAPRESGQEKNTADLASSLPSLLLLPLHSTYTPELDRDRVESRYEKREAGPANLQFLVLEGFLTVFPGFRSPGAARPQAPKPVRISPIAVRRYIALRPYEIRPARGAGKLPLYPISYVCYIAGNSVWRESPRAGNHRKARQEGARNCRGKTCRLGWGECDRTATEYPHIRGSRM